MTRPNKAGWWWLQIGSTKKIVKVCADDGLLHVSEEGYYPILAEYEERVRELSESRYRWLGEAVPPEAALELGAKVIATRDFSVYRQGVKIADIKKGMLGVVTVED